MRVHRLIMLSAALAAAAGLVRAAEVEVETARGARVVEAEPARVAVFDPAAIDSLLAIGVTPDGAPDPLLVPRLEAATAEAARIGTLFEPDFEAVNALAPDLIVVGGRSSPQAEALEDFAPTLDMTIAGAGLFEQALARLAAYGRLFGREAEAEAAAEDLRARLARAREAAADQGDALILLASGPKISAYGPGSRFGWLHDAVGLPPAAEGLETATHGQAVSFEFVLEADPDWLLVIDRGAAVGAAGAGARATLDNEIVGRTEAWKQGRVIYLDPAEIYIAGGGVGALGATLDRLIAAMEEAG